MNRFTTEFREKNLSDDLFSALRQFNLLVVGLMLVGLATGCDSISGFWQDGGELDTGGATTVEVGGLEVHLFAPDTVAVADSFAVRAVVQNQTDGKQIVTTPNSCLVQPGIFDEEGNRVLFEGSRLGCYTAVTTHKISSGDSVEYHLDVQAVLDTSEGEELASPGTYTVRIILDWTTEEKEVERSVERALTVHR